MEKLYKQFVGWVTRWKDSQKIDEFFIARVRLTFYYSATAIVILSGLSIILYNTILSNFSMIIEHSEFNIDPNIAQAIIDRAQDILLNRFLIVDFAIVVVIVVLGFFLTQKTLKPIKTNMQKQKRFIADASHELRTPTAVVISGLEVALLNKNLDLPMAKKTLENTLEEMREFSLLSNSLLDLSKYDVSTQLENEIIDINLLIKDILEKDKNLAKLKEVIIDSKIEIQATVLGNRIELGRVFYNILDNAIKYTLPGGVVTVRDKIISNKYILTISDNGVGIAKDILKKVFDPFFRGDLSRNTSGAGLGLTLSKKIVENHKGTILINSKENKGTDVIISLPISS